MRADSLELRSKINSISKENLPQVVADLAKSKLAFGVLKNSESFDFQISVCTPENVVYFSDLREIIELNTPLGFVGFPFNNSEQNGFFIPANLEISKVLTGENIEIPKDTSPEFQSTSQDEYENAVEEAINAFENREFKKLVLSRKLEIPFTDKSIQKFVARIIELYPLAHLCFFKIPGQGFWVSATPEILVEKKENEPIIKTMALAGTMPFEGQELKWQGWTGKEIEEQALVSRFIKEKLIESGHTEFEEIGPFTIQAGNLLHLRTDYRVRSIFKNSFLLLAVALHPTSAVCGSPRNESLVWIASHESFKREFFSGFAGIIGPNFGKLVVLLRAGKLQNGKFTLYSGAGLTPSSDSKSEWLETGEKMQTLLKALE